MNIQDTMITCVVDVNWAQVGAEEDISDGYIEVFPTKENRITINVICDSTGEIRQSHINTSSL